MKILVACEESQAVTTELRQLGHEAYSCDIIECSGGHPEWHIQQDVLPLLNGYCSFKTNDGEEHTVPTKWDMLIAFPPCTYLTVTGNRWFSQKQYGEKAVERLKNRNEAIAFFLAFTSADCERIAIENPIGVMSTYYGKPEQVIQPYMFGDAFEKKTCLWLKGLLPLVPTDLVSPPPRQKFDSGKSMPEWYADLWHLPKEDRQREREVRHSPVSQKLWRVSGQAQTGLTLCWSR